MSTTTEVQRGSLLVDFPPELLTAICIWVCRRLRDVIDGSLELQYRIELVRDGMIDVDSESQHNLNRALTPVPRQPQTDTGARTTSAERLARLRQLQKAWRTLSWSECVTVPMPGPCCAYELVGGVFCKTQPTVRRSQGTIQNQNQNQNEARGGLGWPGFFNTNAGANGHAQGHGMGEEDDESAVHGSRTMCATWLPSTRAGKGRTVMRDDLGVPTRDFAMDPSQDLMVLFKGGEDPGLPMIVVFPGMLELHVRTMSTNQVHPEARVPVLKTAVLYPVTSVFVQIVDDVVGIMYCVDPARPRITIWNWKTGQLVVDRPSGDLPPGTWDFSFVHSRAFFVTTGNGRGSLELFTFTCDPPDSNPDADANPSSYPSSQPPKLDPSLTHVATLHLPPIHPSVRVLSVGSHTGPFLAGCPPGAAFVSSNEDRIYVLTVQYVHMPTLDGPRTRPRVCVFVHHRALVKYLAKGAAATQKGSGAALEVSWSAWGLTDARMVPHVGVFQWLRYVHGQRVVMLLPASKAGKSTLQVLDFNARRVFDDDTDADGGHAGSNVDAESSSCKTTLQRVYYPTRIVMPNIFVEAVESGLPYREARRDVRGDYSGVMIDDERLVGLKYPAFLTGDMKEIDVFTM